MYHEKNSNTGGVRVPDYKTMYCILCKAADEAVGLTEKTVPEAAELLTEALLKAEEIYVETADDT